MSLIVSLLATVAVYPVGCLVAGLGSLDRILLATAPPAGLGSLALARFTVRLFDEFVRVAGLGSLDFSLATPAFPYRVVNVTGGALSFFGFVTAVLAFEASSSASFDAPYFAAISADLLISFGLSFSSSASNFLEVSINRSLSRSRRRSSSFAFSRSLSFSFSAARLEYRLMYVDTLDAVDLGDRYVPEVNDGR